MTKEKIQNILLILIKIFFVGLLLQFFLQTFVGFGLWRNWPIWSLVWMWKEIIILILFILVCYRTRTHKIWKILLEKLDIKRFVILTLFFGVLGILNGLAITQTWLSATIISLRYSITWFVIFLIFSVVSWEFIDQKVAMERWWSKIIWWLLWGSLFWWAVVFFVPRLLEFAWYNQYNYEWDMGIAPPAAYYSQYNQWYVRNQFLFERPISWGFFLVAFWPLFFVLAIKRRWWKAFVFWWWLYWLAIISTFSRAAWIAWIVQTWILLLIEYRKDIKKAFIYWWIPIVLIFWWVAYIGRDQIIHRQFSNTWHLVNLKLAIEKIQDHTRFGEWPGTAWPASHHLGENKEYNPENQFLQIWIEYGIFGFIAWMILYIWFMWIGWIALRKSFLEKETKQQKYLGYVLFSLSLGIFGLGICWLVLHSFVDRMIVYPFMAMFGLVYGQYKKILA